MVFDIFQVKNLGPFTTKEEKHRTLYFKDDKAFLVCNKNTVEVRCDAKLANHLREKYESVMESRYFGQGGIEIVLADQLTKQEINDLVHLSYNLTN